MKAHNIKFVPATGAVRIDELGKLMLGSCELGGVYKAPDGEVVCMATGRPWNYARAAGIAELVESIIEGQDTPTED